MKSKLLRGINGSVQPRRLLHGYQDAVFAWSGENPFANYAQSTLYRILPRAEYKNDWIKSTPYGQAFRADTYYGSGNGYVFSSHVPSAAQTYAAGVTGYAEFVYSGDSLVGQSIQHLCCLSSSSDDNTGENFNGVLTLGMEALSGVGVCPAFRVGSNEELIGFAGGVGGTLVPVTIPVGAKVRQVVAFDPVSKAYASILTFNDVVYERFGTVANGFASTGSSILVGGYPRNGVRAAYVSGMLEAALWNRGIPPAEMRALLQRPSIFQPTEFIFPFSFGESSDGSGIIKCSKSNLILSANAVQIIQSETINCTTSELILSSKDCAIVLNDPPLIFDTDDYPDRYVFDVYQTPPDVDVIACTSADIAIQTNNCVIVDAENILCSQHPLTLNAYSCDIFETALDALNCLKAELNLQTNACAVLQSEIINCVSYNLDLSSNTAEIAEKSVIESTVSNISLIAYDCDIQASQLINCNQDSFLLQAQSFELLEKEFIFCSAASLSLQNTICNIVEQGLDIVYCDRADISIKSNDSIILYNELIDCSSASIALSAEVSEIYETEILSSDTQVLQLISNNCQLIEQGLDVIGCSKNVTLLIANKCNIVQEGLDVIYCNESTLQISGNKFSTAEIDIISCQVANLSLLANKSFVADTQSILCQEYSVSLVSNICNIVEAGLDVIHAKRADLRLDPINCEIIEFGFDNILCNVGNVKLTAQNCDIYDIEIINCVSATLDVQSSSCDIVEEGLNVVHCKKADIELISNKCSIAENEIISCEQGLAAVQTKKCQIIEFVDFRAAKLDLISNNGFVASNEAINCSAAIININSKRALIVDSNVPPILWSGKIVVTGYVEPIRGIA